jgi:hypothetical protein
MLVMLVMSNSVSVVMVLAAAAAEVALLAWGKTYSAIM